MTQANTKYTRYELQNRYLFEGQLVMETAFHIGGGGIAQSSSDSPVVRTPEGLPFIPGSSLKGSLRSVVERLVPGLPEEAGLRSCALIELTKNQWEEAKAMGQDKQVCPTAYQKAITDERRDNRGQTEDILQKARERLCHTCQLFGSPYAAARLNISDLSLEKQEWDVTVQIRDGVAIDRDSERARDRLKYDFEVVPPDTRFKLKMTFENATDQDVQLLCVGLSEFVNGFGVIGGKRSRGLGTCKIDNLQVSTFDLLEALPEQRNAMLRDYLLKRTFPLVETGKEFIDRHINELFKSENSAQ